MKLLLSAVGFLVVVGLVQAQTSGPPVSNVRPLVFETILAVITIRVVISRAI